MIVNIYSNLALPVPTDDIKIETDWLKQYDYGIMVIPLGVNSWDSFSKAVPGEET